MARQMESAHGETIEQLSKELYLLLDKMDLTDPASDEYDALAERHIAINERLSELSAKAAKPFSEVQRGPE